ncbi:MAG: GAF domain-containing protein, partial [Terriglobales bacterium]
MESHSEAFEQLLLELSGTTLERNDPRQLILSFCRLTRAFFHASGAYYWNCTPEGELVGVEADGQDAARFRGTRLRAEDSSVALTAVRNRRPVVLNESDLNGFDLNERDVNEPDPSKPETGQLGLAGFPISSDLHARTALAAPLLVAGEVIGAIAYLHAARAAFDEIAVSRVTILAAQLCTALEALRLNQLSREERRRAAILADLAARLHGSPDTSPVMENIADRLRDLLGSPAVLIFVQNENLFQ